MAVISMTDDLEDFESLLEPDFDAKQFGNDLLKITNSNDATILDLNTPLKKLNYDLHEVDSRIDQLINNKPLEMIELVYRNEHVNSTIVDELKPSLEYLNISYDRLKTQVLDPYERARKVQLALSKVYQTSFLLRGALVYIHLSNKLNTASKIAQLNISTAVNVASLHYQLQITLEENENLKSLRKIKELEQKIVTPNKRELITFLSLQMSKECLNSVKIKSNKEIISQLAYSLFLLSPQEFASSINKIILSNVTVSSQILSKTINSIRMFPEAFKDVVEKGYNIYTLETILRNIKTDNVTAAAKSSVANKAHLSHLLSEYTSTRNIKAGPSTPRDLFWNKVSSNFKKDFEISVNRGGPVGKVLLKNKDFIIGTIKQNMEKSSDSSDYQKYLDMMLGSVSIISK
ncbi:Cog5p [Saccharomyces cerevisiae x Saccharomyces kudriavzevii VIN7]|uniref:Conserved oligomeric Golgi complex subunit 5 n=1 Tax=Saccharomyces cerevisiae x Saccharomyces kudriavzevii (strain VIN7) TaxID=1095631 RepID=H0H0C1_SACCK|nr:Cog5p [Saccharomyces cerevisiae x Saccharomyces kudriavzevii VIN7]